MNVLVLNHNQRERGTYFRAREVALGLHALGHDVTFVCTGNGYYRSAVTSKRTRWQQVETASWTPFRGHEEGLSPLGIIQRVIKLRRRWDLIYTFSHLPVDQATARLLRGRTAFWMTDWCDLWSSTEGGLHDRRLWADPDPPHMQGVRGFVTRAMYPMEDAMEFAAPRDADAVSIIVSPMRGFTRRLGIPDERVLLLTSGADTKRIRPMNRRAAREALGLPLDARIIGYVANITPDNKQLEGALLRIWKHHPDVLVSSVGPSWYSDDSPMAEAAADGRLRDFGRQPFSEIPKYLAAADVMAMPLRDVPFNRCRWPNKFGDHMAAGRPTATCTVGDMGTVTDRFGIGAAGAPSPGGLANALDQLLEDDAFRVECSRAALRAARGEFSWKRKLEVVCEFLRRRGVRV